MKEIDLQTFKAHARTKRKENKKYFQKLKKAKSKNLDPYFHPLHEVVFERLDCLDCANCCKTTSPIFTKRDIERIAKSMKLKPAQFIETYLRIDEDEDYVLKTSPCPFLESDNKCRIYEDRPKACREYPHTNRKAMHKILDLTYRNTMVCPAVFEIVEELKQVLPPYKI